MSTNPLATMQNDPTGVRQYRVTLLDHSDTIEATRPDLWGDDYIAGGAGDDEIWGQLGNDVIQGDGRDRRPRARAVPGEPDGDRPAAGAPAGARPARASAPGGSGRPTR